MKQNKWILHGIVAIFALLLQTGCQESNRQTEGLATDKGKTLTETKMTETPADANDTEKEAEDESGNPKIKFEKTIHDFGKVAPGIRHNCEFHFKNIGDGILKITKVTKTCGCTPYTLAKKEYAPGESGVLKVKYHATGKRNVKVKKRLYVHSNDKANPKIMLSIKAHIVPKVSYTPKKMNLLLNDANTGCTDITIKSTDGQSFSIKSFNSTAGCITADFDPSKKATEFVLKPKVNIECLRNSLSGTINIGLTHPGCNKVIIVFKTLAEIKIDPPSLNVLNVDPGKAVNREVWILNNYDKNFEIESAASEKGFVKVLSQTKKDNRYQFALEITPPEPKNKQRFFTDTLVVKIKNGRTLQIRCRGFYKRK